MPWPRMTVRTRGGGISGSGSVDAFGTGSEDPTSPEIKSVSFDPEAYRPCHACGQLVRMMALKCRYCGATLHGEASLAMQVEATAHRLQVAGRREAEGSFSHDSAARHGVKIRARTFIAILSLAVCVVTVLLVHLASVVSRNATESITVTGIILGVGALIATAVLVRRDLLVPADEERTTPEAGFKAFFYGMIFGRWSYAHACLLPGDHASLLHRARVADVPHGIRAAVVDVVDAKSLRKLWRPLVDCSDFRGRNVSEVGVESYRLDDRNAIVQCGYTLSSYSRFIYVLLFFFGAFSPLFILIAYFVSLKRSRVELVKWMRRIDDRWYVVSPGIRSGEDMLPKLYGDALDRLEEGDLPPAKVLTQAAAERLREASPESA